MIVFTFKIIYSDNDKMYVPIELSKIKEINAKKHVIDTEVNLCNYYWTGEFPLIPTFPLVYCWNIR